jgi:hypothetical protein
MTSRPLSPPCSEEAFCAFLTSARLSAIASFTLIAGAAFTGVAGSGSFGRRREREGDLVTECVRGRSEEDPRSEEGWNGFALEDIVRGRAAGDFGTRGVEGEAAGREGLTAADG